MLPEPISKLEVPQALHGFVPRMALSTMLHCSLAVPGQRRDLPSGCQFLQWASSSKYFQDLNRREFWPSEETAANSARGKRQQQPSFAITSALERAHSRHHNPWQKERNRQAPRRHTSSSVPFPHLWVFLLPMQNSHRHSEEMIVCFKLFS